MKKINILYRRVPRGPGKPEKVILMKIWKIISRSEKVLKLQGNCLKYGKSNGNFEWHCFLLTWSIKMKSRSSYQKSIILSFSHCFGFCCNSWKLCLRCQEGRSRKFYICSWEGHENVMTIDSLEDATTGGTWKKFTEKEKWLILKWCSTTIDGWQWVLTRKKKM